MEQKVQQAAQNNSTNKFQYNIEVGTLGYEMQNLEQLQKEYPQLKHMINFENQDYENDMVYRPNDDSQFFLDILYLECSSVLKEKQFNNIIEIGAGTGFLINHFLKFLKSNKTQFSQAYATDINEDAIEFTRCLSQKLQNEKVLSVVKTPIMKDIPKSKSEFNNIIICNPPYVPTESWELEKFQNIVDQKENLLKDSQSEKAKQINCIDVSYAGGKDGMEITYKIIEEVSQYMEANDIFYLFLIEENQIQNCLEHLQNKQLQCQILSQNQTECELQFIIKCVKK